MNDAIDADEEELEQYAKQREYLSEQLEEGRDGKLTTQLMGALKQHGGVEGSAYVVYNWDGDSGEYVKEDVIRLREGSLRPETKERYDLILNISLNRPFADYDYVAERVLPQIREQMDKIPNPKRIRNAREKKQKMYNGDLE